MLTLYTFNISHFSEKARWALDLEGIVYEEKVLVPGPHQLVTRRIARRTYVPVLRHEGNVVQESSAILDYVTDHLGGKQLTPTDAADREKTLALETAMDHAFGLGVQRVLYSAMLKDRKAVTDLWAFGTPWARGFYAVAYPAVAAVVARMYRTKDVEGVERAKQRFVTTFDQLDAILNTQPYLGGDQPNRLDITAAALLAPVCRVPEHRMPWPAMPDELAAFEATLRDRPTWNHVMRMYREHRTPLRA